MASPKINTRKVASQFHGEYWEATASAGGHTVKATGKTADEARQKALDRLAEK